MPRISALPDAPGHAAAFASDAGFRRCLSQWLVQPAADLPTQAALRVDWLATPLGPLVAVSDATHLRLLEFPERALLPAALRRLQTAVKGDLGIGRHPPTEQIAAQITAYFGTGDPRFDVPLAPAGTGFMQEVWRALRQIPAGQTQSYGSFAAAIGRPGAARAVARANAANPIAIVIPCHRLLGADGALTGYGGGLWRKRALIDHEARQIRPAAL